MPEGTAESTQDGRTTPPSLPDLLLPSHHNPQQNNLLVLSSGPGTLLLDAQTLLALVQHSATSGAPPEPQCLCTLRVFVLLRHKNT